MHTLGAAFTSADCVDGPGIRWDEDNAEAMLALSALDHSNLWNTYWSLQHAA